MRERRCPIPAVLRDVKEPHFWHVVSLCGLSSPAGYTIPGRAYNEWCEMHDFPYQGSRGVIAPIRSSLVGSSYPLRDADGFNHGRARVHDVRCKCRELGKSAADHALRDIMGIRR